MSYSDINSSMVWLLVDDNGRVIAICANPWIANLAAKPLCASIEASRQGQFNIGDVLPVFHR